MPKPVPESGETWGIFGGVFDPIHYGHLSVARDIASEKKLDGILFVVSYQPPHRTIPCTASFDDRIEMVTRAIEGANTFAVSRIERDMEQPCYTLNTVRALRRKFPEVSWFLVIGADNLANFRSWYHAKELVSEISVLAGARPAFDTSSLSWFPKGSIEFIESSLVDVSSSGIRDMIARGIPREELGRLVPESVAEYIVDQRLYL